MVLMPQETSFHLTIKTMLMLMKKVIISFCIVCFLAGCASTGQINGLKVIEENIHKKYSHFKTDVFKSDATILRDTTNEFNRYPITHAVKQYIPSLTDIQEYENILNKSIVPEENKK